MGLDNQQWLICNNPNKTKQNQKGSHNVGIFQHYRETIYYLIINSIIQDSLNKFPDYFRVGPFIDITHMKL